MSQSGNKSEKPSRSLWQLPNNRSQTPRYVFGPWRHLYSIERTENKRWFIARTNSPEENKTKNKRCIVEQAR